MVLPTVASCSLEPEPMVIPGGGREVLPVCGLAGIAASGFRVGKLTTETPDQMAATCACRRTGCIVSRLAWE